jgi:ribosomal protein S20
MSKKTKQFLWGLFWFLCLVLGIALLWTQVSCLRVGGKEHTNKPNSEFETEIKTAIKNVDDSIRKYGDVSGDLTEIKETLTKIYNTTVTMNQNISKISTNYYGVPPWQLLVAGLLYYTIACYLKYLYRKKKSDG